ncbi:hypothetical protein SAMN05660657_01484 [Geodermatophilus amargosae]|uniref:Uncharacterized protein n=1 Tax=Geodermatophilus amargosae TaxID=1296565 RepID=A0A1I6YYC2_9ACTN|nr:hypothetical protein SAMN05660657_01484 [Geodermatophilus amargosae]
MVGSGLEVSAPPHTVCMPALRQPRPQPDRSPASVASLQDSAQSAPPRQSPQRDRPVHLARKDRADGPQFHHTRAVVSPRPAVWPAGRPPTTGSTHGPDERGAGWRRGRGLASLATQHERRPAAGGVARRGRPFPPACTGRDPGRPGPSRQRCAHRSPTTGVRPSACGGAGWRRGRGLASLATQHERRPAAGSVMNLGADRPARTVEAPWPRSRFIHPAARAPPTGPTALRPNAGPTAVKATRRRGSTSSHGPKTRRRTPWQAPAHRRPASQHQCASTSGHGATSSHPRATSPRRTMTDPRRTATDHPAVRIPLDRDLRSPVRRRTCPPSSLTSSHHRPAHPVPRRQHTRAAQAALPREGEGRGRGRGAKERKPDRVSRFPGLPGAPPGPPLPGRDAATPGEGRGERSEPAPTPGKRATGHPATHGRRPPRWSASGGPHDRTSHLTTAAAPRLRPEMTLGTPDAHQARPRVDLHISPNGGTSGGVVSLQRAV